MIILTGNSNVEYASAVADAIGVKLGKCNVGRFNNGELRFDIDTSLRGQTVYIIFSCGSGDVNVEIMEVLGLAHAAHFASAEKIVLVVPQFPYARQDRKIKSRDIIGARWIMDMCKACFINHIIYIDIHNGAIQGFSGEPNDNLTMVPLFLGTIREEIFSDVEDPTKNIVIVSPDLGGMKRVRNLAEDLKVSFTVIDKNRKEAGVVDKMILLGGDVKDMICILYDDMADTCGTLCQAAEVLMKEGAKEVIAFVTHGIFSLDAIEKIHRSPITKIYVSDSINLKPEVKSSPKVKIVSSVPLVANSICRHFRGMSMGDLFSPDADRDTLMKMLKFERDIITSKNF